MNTPKTFLPLALLAGASITIAGCGTTPSSGSNQFQIRPSAESNVSVQAPALGLEITELKRRDMGFQQFEELTRWRASDGAFAELNLVELDPTGRYSFGSRQQGTLRDLATRWFTDPIEFEGATTTTPAHIGKSQVLRFSSAGSQCLFTRWLGGAVHGDGMVSGGESLGTTFVAGFYCAPDGAELPDNRLAAFVRGIRVK